MNGCLLRCGFSSWRLTQITKADCVAGLVYHWSARDVKLRTESCAAVGQCGGQDLCCRLWCRGCCGALVVDLSSIGNQQPASGVHHLSAWPTIALATCSVTVLHSELCSKMILSSSCALGTRCAKNGCLCHKEMSFVRGPFPRRGRAAAFWDSWSLPFDT
jgi:hypothetical protein